MTATDLDVTITVRWKPQSRNPALTMPVKKLFGIVRELANPEIELETDDKNVTSLRSGSSFFKIRGLGAEEFPPPPKFKEDKKVVLPQEKIRGMLRRPRLRFRPDESRYVLNGIYMMLKEHKLTMVATDGRRHAGGRGSGRVEKEPGRVHRARQGRQRIEPALQDKGEIDIRYTDNQAAFALKDDKDSRS